MNRIILDEHDAAQLLRVLYNGRRPRRVHTLICLCGAVADLRQSPRAWNGWQILPHAVCPKCIARGPRPEVEFYPDQARTRFVNQIQKPNEKDRAVCDPVELFALIGDNQ